MGVMTGIGLGIGALTSGFAAIDGNNRRKRAEAELRNLVPPELRNAYKDVPLSTYGSRIASENLAQNNSNMIASAQRGGIRALTSIAPTLTQANIQQNQAIAQDIDNQYRQNKMNEAQGEMQIQGLQENRYQGALAGLAKERSAGIQDTYTGLSNLSQSVMAIGEAGGDNLFRSGGNKELTKSPTNVNNPSVQFPQGTGPYQYETPSFVPYPARVGNQKNQFLYFPVGERK